MPLRKHFVSLILVCLAAASGCSAREKAGSVPSDFALMIDVRGVGNDMPGNIHVNIKIDARGNGRYEYYDSDGSINYDLNDIVIYKSSQVIKSGKFKLSGENLEKLWNILNQNHFFELDEHYQMQIGYSYAFILVEANKKQHIVDNIGMEVPEIKAIVEGSRSILPQEISFEYGKGVKP